MIRPAETGVEGGVFALTRPRSKPLSGSRWRPLLAAAAAASLAFSNGRHTVPLLAWIGPLLFLHWLRAAPSGGRGRWVGPLAAYVLFLSAWTVQWRGIVRSPPLEFAITAVAIAAMGFSPYLLDRWVARRLPAAASSWIGTLVFPSALVAMETLWSHFGPNGSFGAIGYTQANDTSLLQLAAMAGVAGLSFLVGWVASAGSLLWRRLEDGARGPALTIGAAIALVLLAAHAGGALRLRHADAGDAALSRSRTLRAAAISPHLDDNVNYDLAVSGEIRDFLFARSEPEIRDGAQLVIWPEDSFAIAEADQPDFRRRAARFAADHSIYLAVGYGVRPDPASRRFANQLALWGPDGRQLWEYRKVHPVPGFEQRYMERGIEPMPVAETPFGRWSAAICYDGDYPRFISQAGRAGADLLLLPADDWRAIAPLHARMSVFRAVEQGMAVLRPTMNGVSLATDAYGRVLARLDHFVTGDRPRDRVMPVLLPVTGVPTIYRTVGDAFAWLATAGCGAWVLVAILGRRRAE